MRVFLDDAELTVPEPTLTAVLAAGSAASEARGRIVVEVWADGEPAPDEDLAQPPDRAPYAGEVRLITAEPRALVRSVLFDVADALEATRDTQRRAADLIQVGETGKGLHELGEALRSWDTVRRAVEEGAALLGMSVNSDESSAIDGSLVEELGRTLTSVKQALSREDWALLSDLLMYDLEEQAQRWETELRRLAERITLTDQK